LGSEAQSRRICPNVAINVSKSDPNTIICAA